MKILLAEDDSSISAIAELALSKVGGHEVVTVKDGQELIDCVHRVKPDLILLDVMMPRMDGFETCARLKADEATKSIPVLFLTAKAQTHEQQHGMTLGAMGYILKPFDPMTLHTQIDEVLHANAKASA